MALREHARTIWQAGVEAANPERLVRDFLARPPQALADALNSAKRILVVGGGKAGTPMSKGVEAVLADRLAILDGVVNVPNETAETLSTIRLHGGRPSGVNHPTSEGVVGVEEQLQLVRSLEPGDVGLCLLSGGGSALLPAPAEGISLKDKQTVTKVLHQCGATINEMNCVRKHLSAIKGGGLAKEFTDRHCPLFTLIISDVIGDPLDVIASGPTEADPTSFGDAKRILDKYALTSSVPASVRARIERGVAGEVPETLKQRPESVHIHVLGNNARSLQASAKCADELGYHVVNLGAFWEGETKEVALVMAGLARSIVRDGMPSSPPVCILSGGETTVTLGTDPGKGGRNQEMVLAVLDKLQTVGMQDVLMLSGGTDGEDGPTDAAGALADSATLDRASALGLSPREYLTRHDAYSFFEQTGDLLRTGLTQTNVMDIRVLLVGMP